ncbi:MAG: DOMON-like domain-containing protein [Zoogloeaceae bacterium]|jgi:hypothetical protein|nr:DOMON-like domain-containing protein [Zoogloeaceae bacterium]
MTSIRFSAALLPHPDSPVSEADAVTVAGAWSKENGLRLNYRLCGDLLAFLFPVPGQKLDANRLWAHSCCEVFLATAGRSAYREYNFSRSGQWAAFDFSGYRQPAPLSPRPLPAPEMRWQDTPAAPLRLAIAVVLERLEGRFAYWALRHPPGLPDFHHPVQFALILS